MLVRKVYAMEAGRIDSKFLSLSTWSDSNPACPGVFPVSGNVHEC